MSDEESFHTSVHSKLISIKTFHSHKMAILYILSEFTQFILTLYYLFKSKIQNISAKK